MRRDRIFNVICNHTISKQLTFKPFPNSLTSFTWFAKDYSEETEGIDKMFTLRFKVITYSFVEPLSIYIYFILLYEFRMKILLRNSKLQ